MQIETDWLPTHGGCNACFAGATNAVYYGLFHTIPTSCAAAAAVEAAVEAVQQQPQTIDGWLHWVCFPCTIRSSGAEAFKEEKRAAESSEENAGHVHLIVVLMV